MKYEIIPGILEQAQADVQKKFETASFAPTIQIDIIDKKFAQHTINPDLSFTKKYPTHLELHLMTENPEDWIDSYQGLGIEKIAGHIEYMTNPTKFISKLREMKIDPYIAIDLPTQVDSKIDDLILKGAKGVLIMTVKAGKSGQKFQESALEKVKKLRKRHPELNIEIDGGVSLQSIPQALKAGANMFTATSAIFSTGDPKQNYQALTAKLPK